ncbi:unnamed protein product, partial [marine sediment metagenome]
WSSGFWYFMFNVPGTVMPNLAFTIDAFVIRFTT